LLKSCLNIEKDGAIIVSTPQEVAMADVRKEINFCKKTQIKILGVIENMNYFDTKLNKTQILKKVDGDGNKTVDCSNEIYSLIEKHNPGLLEKLILRNEVITKHNGGCETMAKDFNIPYITSVPLDKHLQMACDLGKPDMIINNIENEIGPATEIFLNVAQKIITNEL